MKWIKQKRGDKEEQENKQAEKYVSGGVGATPTLLALLERAGGGERAMMSSRLQSVSRHEPNHPNTEQMTPLKGISRIKHDATMWRHTHHIIRQCRLNKGINMQLIDGKQWRQPMTPPIGQRDATYQIPDWIEWRQLDAMKITAFCALGYVYGFPNHVKLHTISPEALMIGVG